jgi:hypothetical protein
MMEYLQQFKATAKKLPLAVPVKRYVWDQGLAPLKRFLLDRTYLNVAAAFPMYWPNSAIGSYKTGASICLKTVNQIFPSLSELCETVRGIEIAILEPHALFDLEKSADSIATLKVLFDEHGSDKASVHSYHELYGSILSDRNSICAILEIGLGTNNLDVPSNMGQGGKPGASIRAFKMFLPNADIFGADIDTRILFEEERIKTFYVDQTKPESLISLGEQIPECLDLVIDDGLHSPNANVETLRFALGKIKVGGWVIIEDIPRCALPIWKVVQSVIDARFRSAIISTRAAFVFAVQRLK